MGFNRRKMEDQRRQAAEKEAATRRATDAQVLEDAERLIAAWNERQTKRMPMLFSPTIGAAIAAHLAVIADGMNRAIAANPSEVFLIEGHTDAVGSEIDNLSLSDRRAESVALVLSQQFGVPAENLTTQGYGDQYLKVPTRGPERANRRVTVRRITPLLTGQNQAIPLAPR
jgi:outer membrane protein OmpA-like peptidoglycan-associated protein